MNLAVLVLCYHFVMILWLCCILADNNIINWYDNFWNIVNFAVSCLRLIKGDRRKTHRSISSKHTNKCLMDLFLCCCQNSAIFCYNLTGRFAIKPKEVKCLLKMLQMLFNWFSNAYQFRLFKIYISSFSQRSSRISGPPKTVNPSFKLQECEYGCQYISKKAAVDKQNKNSKQSLKLGWVRWVQSRIWRMLLKDIFWVLFSLFFL